MYILLYCKVEVESRGKVSAVKVELQLQVDFVELSDCSFKNDTLQNFRLDFMLIMISCLKMLLLIVVMTTSACVTSVVQL